MKFQIQDMTCGGCATRVTKAVQSIDPTATVEADVASKVVTIQSKATSEQVVAVLTDAGYPPKAV